MGWKLFYVDGIILNSVEEVLKLFKAFLNPLKSLILALSQPTQLVDHQKCYSKRMFPKLVNVTVQPELVAWQEDRKSTPPRPAGYVLDVSV